METTILYQGYIGIPGFEAREGQKGATSGARRR